MAIITGFPTDDNLVDTVEDDQISSLGGNDTITVTAGNDTADGGTDTDRLIVSYGASADGIQNRGENGFGAGASGGTRSVTFTAIESFDVTTGSGADSIRTFVREDVSNNANPNVISGNDAIRTGGGADTAAGGQGNDSLFGGADNDILDGDGSLSGKFGGGGNLTTVEFIGDDMISGEAGNDSLYGGNGSDILDGGIGDDLLVGDRIIFQARDSSSIGGGGITLQENTGNDALSGADTLLGGDGNDTLVGNAGNDSIAGGAGNDTARVTITSDGADTVDLGTGNDIVEVTANASGGVSSAVRVTFTSAAVGNGSATDATSTAPQDGGLAVRLQSEDLADGLVGPVSRYDDEGTTFVGQGDVTFDVRDLISGAQRGNLFKSVTLGTAAGDLSVTGAGAAYVNAGMGNDTVVGGASNDFLVGGEGSDVLSAAAGADSFLGGAGDDLMVGGAGADMLDGGAGTDTASYLDSAAAVMINLGAGTASGGDAAGDVLTAVERVLGSAQNDVLVGGGGAETLFGGGGDDFLLGGVGADYLDGGDGPDTASYAASAAAVSVNLLARVGAGGDAAGDVIVNIERVVGSDFNDTLIGDANNNLLAGGAGEDFLAGGAGADMLMGGTGTDTVGYLGSTAGVRVFLETGQGFGGDAEGDQLTDIEYVGGSVFADVLVGNAGGNRLVGETGNDYLLGRGGADILVGGGGADRFVYVALTDSAPGPGVDLVADFSRGEGDVMDLSLLLGGLGYRFVGDAAFTGAGPQLRAQAAGGGRFLVETDSGDGQADFRIAVQTVDITGPMLASDFAF